MIYMIKIKLLIALVFVNVSCSSIGESLPFYRYTIGTWYAYFSSLGLEISEEQHNQVPFAYIYARIGSSRFSRLILLSEQDGVLEWISADKEKIYTLNGKIVKTEGLENDFEILNKEIFKNFPFEESYYPISDFYNPPLFNLQGEVILSKSKLEEIKHPISGRAKIPATLYVESNKINKIFWNSRNKYYFNASGSIEKTVQKVHPNIPEIEILFVRKYSK